MNIICYVNKLANGGAERVMSVLANGLIRRGHKVTMVNDYSLPNEYPLDKEIEQVILDGEFRGESAKGRITRTIRRISKLHRLCKQKNADIIVSFIEDANSRALLATRGLTTKNLISVRIDPKRLLDSRVSRAQIELLYPLAEGCVLQTNEAQQTMPARISKKSRVIFNPASEVFYKVSGTPGLEKRVVSCGRLVKQKRFDLLIDAFDKVCDEFPDYKLEIYGVGVLQNALQAQIDKLARQDRIRLMGRSEDVPNAIKAASLFVLSSDYEGLPNALMEAMVLGLPVISTNCGGGGARALIDDGVDGLIVPCGDVEALADAIRKSLSDPDAAKQRGDKAAEKAKGFSAEVVVSQWETYIRDIVEGRA